MTRDLVRNCSLIVLAATLGCTSANRFTPTGPANYEPSSTEVSVLNSDGPTQDYEVLGYVEARGSDLNDALPHLKKLAWQNGGQALWKIESNGVKNGINKYRAMVIRYNEGC